MICGSMICQRMNGRGCRERITNMRRDCITPNVNLPLIMFLTRECEAALIMLMPMETSGYLAAHIFTLTPACTMISGFLIRTHWNGHGSAVTPSWTSRDTGEQLVFLLLQINLRAEKVLSHGKI